jgi:hypothetical protein
MSDSDHTKGEQFEPNPEDLSDHELIELSEQFAKSTQQPWKPLIYLRLTNPDEDRGLPRDASGQVIGMHSVTLGPYLWVTMHGGEMRACLGSDQDRPLTMPAEITIATFDEDAGGWRVHTAAEGWQPVYTILAFSTADKSTGKPMT